MGTIIRHNLRLWIKKKKKIMKLIFMARWSKSIYWEIKSKYNFRMLCFSTIPYFTICSMVTSTPQQRTCTVWPDSLESMMPFSECHMDTRHRLENEAWSSQVHASFVCLISISENKVDMFRGIGWFLFEWSGSCFSCDRWRKAACGHRTGNP